MKTHSGTLLAIFSLWAALAAPVVADTVVLTDGTIYEGKIVKETAKYIKLETKTGPRSIRRSKIEKIVMEDAGASAEARIAQESFEELDDLAKALKNAEALYELGKFNEIPSYVEPFRGKGTKIDDMRIRWLIIENYERQADWGEADELLDKTDDDGREPDKIRAKEHLKLFEENPDHSLREVNGERSRHFLTDDQWARAKEKDALADRELMEIALRRRVQQVLRDPKISVRTFERSLAIEETKGAIDAEVKAESRNYVKALPYLEQLEKVEQSVYRADAIIPGAAEGYRLDLVRTEADHLINVLYAILNEVSNSYPNEAELPKRDDVNAREQWRERCDKFLKDSEPVEPLIAYLLSRTRGYPVKLRPLIEEWEHVLERFQQMRQSVIRNRDRTQP